jgi:hypothetical protein
MNRLSHKRRKTVIRFLASISLLVFFLPFFQMCSDENIRAESAFLKTYKNAENEEQKEIAFKKSKKEFSLSGYDLAMSFEPIFWVFTLIMVINITLWVCFFRKHYKLLFLCFLNLSIIIVSLLVLAFSLPNIGQIRYGIFLCLINSSLLFYFVYKECEETAYSSLA